MCVLYPVINGEKAAYSTPVFADKRERTLDLLLKNIEQKNYSTKVKQDVNTTCIVYAVPETEGKHPITVRKQKIQQRS